jgi:hypothetical protein
MIDRILNLFTKKVDTKDHYFIPPGDQESVVLTNRESLKDVSDWIDTEAMNLSFFNYGVPAFIRSEINKPIGNELTYTDLMLYLSRKHFSELKYLEIGVSVGKNFYQILNGLKKGSFFGFDIEEINPALESKLQYLGQTTWKTPRKSIKKTDSSIKSYNYFEGKVGYLCGDVWDENSWARLKGNRFNLVFSDALHTPAAILFEFEMLVKYDLLDDKFIIVWDDLVGQMENSFYRIIRKYDNRYKIADKYLLNINGWVGVNEAPHTVGLISNFVL